MGMIAYITVNAPFGRLGETYIITEMITLKKLGTEVLITPRDNSQELFHKRARPLVDDTLSMPRFNAKILKKFLIFIFKRPLTFLRLLTMIVFNARNIEIALKNLAIFPKACYLSNIFKEQSVSHVHAHYGSTTSTMSLIISEITEIPWSFTVHRWDIPENNLLKEKIESASFVRPIDESGREEVDEIIKDVILSNKIKVLHMGVEMPENIKRTISTSKSLTLLCPAMLVPKKGHRYLFEACKILVDRGIEFKCLVAGEGQLENELRALVAELNLEGKITFMGGVSQEHILGLYKNKQVHVVVLPSIVTKNGDKEGIPVALMEAMSYGIPVISTDTGGIPELIGDGSGILITEKDPEAIASSVQRLMQDETYKSISEKGRKKIESEFNSQLISKELSVLFHQYSVKQMMSQEEK